jgi:hypothetical protein
MKVVCRSNNIYNLDKRLLSFAFGQDEKGVIDLTIGKEYEAYGVRKNRYGTFYLLTTDELNKKLPWWMPAGLFESKQDIPSSWVEKRYGVFNKNKEITNKYYLGYELDIEDGTKRGHEAFKDMVADEKKLT